MNIRFKSLLYFVIVIQFATLANFYVLLVGNSRTEDNTGGNFGSDSKSKTRSMPYYLDDEDYDSYEDDFGSGYDTPEGLLNLMDMESYETKVIDLNANNDDWDGLESPVIIYYEPTDSKMTTTTERPSNFDQFDFTSAEYDFESYEVVTNYNFVDNYGHTMVLNRNDDAPGRQSEENKVKATESDKVKSELTELDAPTIDMEF